MTSQIAVVGATGTLGSFVVDLVRRTPGLELHAGLSSRDDLDDVRGADLVVDVTHPAVSPGIVEHVVRAGLPVLVGTSGWNAERVAKLRTVVADVGGPGVLVVPNFSLGSVLATRFATMAARFYESVEIVEAHHQGKVDSPSGTAVRTAELIAEARRELGPVSAPFSDQRARGQQVASVPVHSMRLRGVVAKQEVVFGGEGETLTLTHDTISQRAYEQGLLVALAEAPRVEGVVVGLDSVLPLD
ncbi:4-hydroxy-tetrahydrodipicolinate reductase [Frigoribacterium sp. ACAM 257]|jgi:4-hydroxy-tetrahydrodipicolinate reductase|uniref:4-hydroxy-tetrahydrodipicolinate reductase n=1 Tax=Frigoribacterium sp. ACAM 257 TaxID=2508998 RepID=UPI0011B9D62C|nr:4-hydroxy-tetrahydrodipicolinate reductase [Frigoribacterium sp. ACAM 257]TWX37380.1 4-hydroxy-tetrahydrodipicolinate reductase [Frigoribacterium sp. ACAM 257]